MMQSLIVLMIKERKPGARYANNLYSGGIIGSILLLSMPLVLRMKRWYRYEEKKELSMHIKRIPYMLLISNVKINGSEIRPLMGEFFGSMGTGP